jgi:hypothetical protein
MERTFMLNAIEIMEENKSRREIREAEDEKIAQFITDPANKEIVEKVKNLTLMVHAVDLLLNEEGRKCGRLPKVLEQEQHTIKRPLLWPILGENPDWQVREVCKKYIANFSPEDLKKLVDKLEADGYQSTPVIKNENKWNLFDFYN